MQEKQLCPVCLSQGRRSYLRSFQVNLEEGLLLCENKRCIYPLGQEIDPTFHRPFDDLPSERDNPTRVPSAQLALQIQVASRLTECHQRKQTDVIGIQTGSPLFMKQLAKRQKFKQNGLNLKSHQNGKTTDIKDPLSSSTTTDSKSESKFPGLQLGKTNGTNGLTNGHHVEGHTRPVTNHSDILTKNLKNGIDGINLCRTPHNGLQNGVEVNGSSKTLSDCDDTKKAECGTNSTNGQPSGPATEPFLQWKNQDALCWLDVVLCLLVHNKLLKQLVNSNDCTLTNSLVYKLITAHSQARALMLKQNLSSRHVTVNGHNKANSSQSPLLSNNTSHMNGQTAAPGCEIPPVVSGDQTSPLPSDMLNEVRDEVWSFVREKIQCEKGRPSSPVEALKALLQSDPVVDGLFRSTYRFTYSCPHCEFLEDIECDGVLPSLPELVKDFNIASPIHKKKCLNCSYTKGKRRMVYKMLPKCFLMHFLEGLPTSSWSSLEFTLEDVHYTVTGVVQYLRNPDHFVAWLRNPKDNTWILCDDLKSPVCQIRVQSPKFSWKQIHIVMWEQTDTLEPSSSNGGETLCRSHRNDVTVESRTVKVSNKACEEWLNGLDRHDNAGTLVNGFTTDTTFSKTLDNYMKQRNGNGQYETGESRFNDCLKTPVPSSLSDLSAWVPKSSRCRAMLDLSYTSSEMSTSKQQISIDSLRFLKSSTTHTSSLERSACSSLSSTCSELSDNVSLPEFVSTAQVAKGLVKPIACRNDSPVQNSEFLDRNVSEADPNCDIPVNTDTVCGARIDRQQATLPHGVTVWSGSDAQCTNTYLEHVSMPIPNIKPSSVFCAPLKLASKQCEVPTVKSESILPESHKINGPINQSASQPNSVQKLKSINNDKPISSVVKNEPLNSNVSMSTVKEEPVKLSEDKNSFRFKLPGLLRKKRKPSNTCISRDAFRTLTRTVDKPNSDTSPNPTERSSTSASSSPCTSPVTGNRAPYLSAVKQYLIDKTTDKSHYKTKFEGLNLKSAPHLGRSIDLSGLKRNDVDSPQEVKSSPVSGKASRNSKLSIVSDTLLKRRRQIMNKAPGSKRLKTDQGGTLDRASETTDILTASASILSTYPELSDKGENNDRPNHNGAVLNIKSESVKGDNANDERPSSFPNNKENGDALQSPEKILNKADPETGSILQDLYDALNIPFTSIKETMSDIMLDVDDILGNMDTKDLDPCQPSKTDATHLPLGNQAHLDCGLVLMSRLVPQSPHMMRQIWSPG